MDGGCAKGSACCRGVCRLNGLACARHSPQHRAFPSHFPQEQRKMNKGGFPTLQCRGKVGKAIGAETLMSKSHQVRICNEVPNEPWTSLTRRILIRRSIRFIEEVWCLKMLAWSDSQFNAWLFNFLKLNLHKRHAEKINDWSHRLALKESFEHKWNPGHILCLVYLITH